MKRAWPQALAWAGLVLVASLAAALRYGMVEPPTAAHLCAAAAPPAWCGLRELVVRGFISNAFGYAALAATALALAWRHRASAWIAAACGFFALVLYCFQAGALALLIGCLLLLRTRPAGRMAAPGGEDGRGQQQVQQQP